MISNTTAPGRPGAGVFLAGALLILCVSELFRLFAGDGSASHLSRLAFLAMCPALLPHFTFREWAMTALGGALAAGLWLRDDTGAILYALDRAAFFGAFIFLVTLLKEAAQRSRSVLDLGVWVTRQQQGRRYYALSIGGHVMGVLLNFGAISLLTPLIQRGARAMAGGPGGASAAQLEQQQISALLRGFSWMILWAPTALTQAVLFTAFPGANAAVVIPLGIAASVVMVLVGRALDRLYWRGLTGSAVSQPPVFPRHSAGRFAAICACLIAVTFAVAFGAQVRAAVALMLVAPVMMICWIFLQGVAGGSANALRDTARTLYDIFVRTVREPARSAYVLGTAGFIGETGAALAPVAEVAAALNIDAAPAWIVLAALPALIVLGGQLALSPIIMVVFLGAVLNELPVLPASPDLIVFALGAGWALSMTASPNASATLLIAAITRIAPTTLTWRWNGVYALTCFAVFVVAFRILAG